MNDKTNNAENADSRKKGQKVSKNIMQPYHFLNGIHIGNTHK